MLVSIEEAVEIYRPLAQQSPLVYNEFLKDGLKLLDDCLCKLEREEDAQKTREEAGRISLSAK